MSLLMVMTTPAFACGALVLSAGLLFGLWLGRRQASAGLRMSQSHRLLHAFERLFRWTKEFAGEVSEYRTVVDEVAARFSDFRDEAPSEKDPAQQSAAALHLLEQIVKANENVQQRLSAAEVKLQQQAAELASYVSEARTDALTGLSNRRAFDDELSRRFAEWLRYGAPISVLLVDVDHFKKFNDRHGHLTGDAVLHDVAGVVRDTMRQCDMTARFGGEEFAVILPNTAVAEARRAAHRALAAVEQHVVRYKDEALKVTVSCGVAQALPGENSGSLISRADAALYSAKKAGRNAAHWHDGVRCLPVDENAPLDQPARLPASDTTRARNSAADFTQLCGDLQRRLKEVVADN